VPWDNDHILEPCFITSTQKVLYESIGVGSGTLNPSVGAHVYSQGALAAVTATASAGYTFDYWTKDGVRQPAQSPANQITVTMDVDHTLTASFAPPKYLRVSTSSNKGTTSPGPGTYAYTVNTYSATFSPVPIYPYTLSYWLVDGRAQYTSWTISIYMDGDHTLEAYWKTMGCVAEGTEVTMADWTTKEIEKIKVGDQVLGYDTATSAFVVETILDTHKTCVGGVLSLNDGALRVTPYDQKIWVANGQYTGWVVDPINIKIGWQIYNALKGSWVTVTSLDIENGKIWVYDITTDGPQTYVADSYLVKDKPIP